MAIYHNSFSRVQRSKGGNALASYAYISGERVLDENTQRTFDYTRKERVVESGMMLPEDSQHAFASAKELIQSIEKYERSETAQTALKDELALPRELSLEEQEAAVQSYIKKNFTAHGFACVYGIHSDPDGMNPHAHLLVPNRALKEGQWQAIKSKKVYALDEEGNRIPVLDEHGEQKLGKRNEKLWKRTTVSKHLLDSKDFLLDCRKSWEEECNRYLENTQQITCASYEAQGLTAQGYEPTVHEGYAVREMESRGIATEIGEQNRQIREHNNALSKLLETIENLEREVATRAREATERALEKLRSVFSTQPLNATSNSRTSGSTPTNAEQSEQLATAESVAFLRSEQRREAEERKRLAQQQAEEQRKQLTQKRSSHSEEHEHTQGFSRGMHM